MLNHLAVNLELLRECASRTSPTVAILGGLRVGKIAFVRVSGCIGPVFPAVSVPGPHKSRRHPALCDRHTGKPPNSCDCVQGHSEPRQWVALQGGLHELLQFLDRHERATNLHVSHFPDGCGRASAAWGRTCGNQGGNRGCVGEPAVAAARVQRHKRTGGEAGEDVAVSPVRRADRVAVLAGASRRVDAAPGAVLRPKNGVCAAGAG
mmetsp:Transcript_37220/g.93429  ORF Transcript_37220/g.93429 Transcript_37220/m.93429 type:complete len:207 (-) Transcript_37220:102-722(-)